MAPPTDTATTGLAMVTPELAARARAWLAGDPDPVTRDCLTALLSAAESGDAAAAEELADAVGIDLEFGTAGLRGAMGAGSNRMNTAVVIRAAAAISAFLHDRLPGADPSPLVVVGYDARHGSKDFAVTTAAVLTAAGCRAALLGGPLPTPVLAASIRRLGSDAGIMVTASHNPAQDNGYKVYLGGRIAPGPGAGVQIVPPTDSDIADRIRTGPAALDVPRSEGGWQVLGDEPAETFIAAAAATALRRPPDAPPRVPPPARRLRIVATALHGVGANTLQAALIAAGFDPPAFVASQRDPDPDFPTVAFPNPEEPGALDESFALAREVGADLVVAVDPDADRCALGVRDATGTWRRLTGDETGAVLGEHLLARRSGSALSPDPGEPPTVANSIVSSELLAKIAAAHGVRHATTLTGFKWIARVPGLVYGYEEAIGYCVDPATVRDKDGISTAVVACELAAQLAAADRTLLDALDDLALRHGVYATAPVTVRLRDQTVVPAVLAGILADPPVSLDGTAVTSVEDLSTGGAGLPGTPGVRLRCGEQIRVVIRPSGTEPKLKAYLQVVGGIPDGGRPDLARARDAADARLVRLAAVVTDLML